MATPESKTKKLIDKVLKPLEGKDVYYFMPVQGKFAKKGVPDYIICYKGVFIGVEAKAEGKANTTTELQEEHLTNIKKAGGYSLVIDSNDGIDELKKIFRFIDIFHATMENANKLLGIKNI